MGNVINHLVSASFDQKAFVVNDIGFDQQEVYQNTQAPRA